MEINTNAAGSVIVDRQTEIDWNAAEAVAEKCDSRTALLVSVRHVDSLRLWLRAVMAVSDMLGPQAAVYCELAEIVGVAAPQFVAGGDVDPNGDLVAGGGAA